MKKTIFSTIAFTFIFSTAVFSIELVTSETEKKIDALIEKMTLEEKIGQMTQRNARSGSEPFEGMIRDGKIGSILNEVNVEAVNRAQKIAVEESRLAIPLIVGRDVIHGFRTIFPIPLGLAATWNPQLVEEGSRIAALEARSVGVNWTFAPMMDIARDPRWGRIAEGYGEDPYLASRMAAAMVRGFQSDDLASPNALAACMKHFVGYGAAIGGRDYNTTYIPELLLRDIYLPPFKASVDAGAATLMTAFNDLNGVPATGNAFILRDILKGEWAFQGFVVSDWASVTQMVPHGYCADHKEAAEKAVVAGVDMEMETPSYADHIAELLDEGALTLEMIDDAVRRILRVKFALGLFDNPYTDTAHYPTLANEKHLAAAKEAAKQSVVLLKNDGHLLPLSKEMSVAVIGPLADAPQEQLGTWAFDGRAEESQTPLTALRDFLSPEKINYVQALPYSRAKETHDFDQAAQAAERSDVVLLFMGEEAILSGEAHCRANLDLPGAQEQLIKVIASAGKPIVLVVMAGRPLTMGNILEHIDALLYAFHPGSMGGPAVVDLLFGIDSPSGKLTVTFPKVVGQIPMYYNHKNTGRPPQASSWVHIDDIPLNAWQTSLGNESHYLDAGFTPQYPFGYGLSYTTFEYKDLQLSSPAIKMGEALTVSAVIRNSGAMRATEIVQLYCRDLAASITRPVRELKGFERITLEPGECRTVEFVLTTEDLAFPGPDMKMVAEPGAFHVWIAPSSEGGLMGEFSIAE
ncbi:glycoside hydrolase family 3 C-terminal domain-containing protein [candidate division KSB1 bacterium]|nr:glycoside hydrolase family 3 C-terminal domain-containing protein [candidate division KSB1 bacterium]RQW06515.1 MAG: glycosyl hydrolase [candidate division KSB1 bacterium]